MGEMAMRVTTAEFEQDAGRYQDAAQQAPVAIIKNGRLHAVLVSAAFFELALGGRVARAVENLDDETLRAIAKSSVGSEHAALDGLLEDWSP